MRFGIEQDGTRRCGHCGGRLRKKEHGFCTDCIQQHRDLERLVDELADGFNQSLKNMHGKSCDELSETD